MEWTFEKGHLIRAEKIKNYCMYDYEWKSRETIKLFDGNTKRFEKYSSLLNTVCSFTVIVKDNNENKKNFYQIKTCSDIVNDSNKVTDFTRPIIDEVAKNVSIFEVYRSNTVSKQYFFIEQLSNNIRRTFSLFLNSEDEKVKVAKILSDDFSIEEDLENKLNRAILNREVNINYKKRTKNNQTFLNIESIEFCNNDDFF